MWPAATSSVRLRVRVALPVRLAEVARRVVPLPAMVPPVQSKPEAMLSVPAPSSVPATWRKVPPPTMDALPAVDSVAPCKSRLPAETVAC